MGPRVFYRFFRCDWCHQDIYEIVGTPTPHLPRCLGCSLLHSVIPPSLSPIQIAASLPEAIGSHPQTDHILPEPGFLRCGKCCQFFRREVISRHTFYCQSPKPSEGVGPKQIRIAHTQFISMTAFRIEFRIWFFSCLSLLYCFC